MKLVEEGRATVTDDWWRVITMLTMRMRNMMMCVSISIMMMVIDNLV